MKKTLFFGLLLLNQANHAQALPGHWQCQALDGNNRWYASQAKDLSQALKKAYTKCRSASRVKYSCRVAQSYCKQGPLSLIENRCIATDNTGRTWNTDGVNPCRTAVSLCTQWQFRYGNSRGSSCLVRHRSS